MRDNEEFKKLQQRVNAVEEENEALRQQIARFLPDGETRRQFLKMGATGVGGLGIGLALSGGASGQGTAGTIGTSGSPVGNIYTNSITDGSSGNSYDIDTLASSGGGANVEFTSNYGTDAAAIQSALNEHGSDQSLVIIDPIGTDAPYVGEGVSIPSNTVVEIREDCGLQDSASENFLETSVGASNIQILGLGGVIDGNKSNITGDGAGATQNTLLVAEAVNVLVEGVETVNSIYHGVVTQACDNITIRDCTFSGHGQRAIMVSRDIAATTPNRNVRVVDNYATNCNTGPIDSGTAIALQGIVGGTVRGNTIESTGEGGIAVETEDAGLLCERVTVADNTVECQRWGIVVSPRNGNPSENITITGNAVDTTAGSTTDATGIFLKADRDEDIREVTIADNTVEAYNYGIGMIGDSGSDIDNATITGNNVTSTNQAGIVVADAKKPTVVGNDCHDCYRAGIKVEEFNNTTTDASVSDNNCSNNGTGVSGDNDSGIFMVAGSGCSIMGNDCTGQNYGVAVASGSVNAVVAFNDLRNNSTAGLDDSGSGTVTDPTGGSSSYNFV